MKIIIAGAGAMGSRFGFMLHKNGQDVTLVDGWKDHVDVIKEQGLQVNYNGEMFSEDIPVLLQSEISEDESADLVILFTKAMQLDKMLTDIKPLLGADTKVLCLLNGIGHEDTIEKYVDLNNMFLGNTMWTAGMEGPGNIKLFGEGSVELQNLVDGNEEKAKEIAAILKDAGLNASYSDNIKQSIYQKACVNGTMNSLCTILDVNMAGLGATSTAKAMVSTIIDEFAAVAAHEGIEIDRANVDKKIAECFDADGIGMHYPSMYQDLMKNNRLTEVDYINGAISRKGKKYGIATPYCDFLCQLVHAKEDILEAK